MRTPSKRNSYNNPMKSTFRELKVANLESNKILKMIVSEFYPNSVGNDLHVTYSMSNPCSLVRVLALWLQFSDLP